MRSLKDASTAESYCTLGGDVISAKIAVQVSELLGLETWGLLVANGGITGPPSTRSKQGNGTVINGVSAKGVVASRSGMTKPHVDDVTKKELIKVLMQVYMGEG